MKLVAIFMVLAMTVGQVAAQEAALRHVVAFKFKSDASEEQVHSLIKAFGDLKNNIPEIQSFEWGVNNSPEGLERGLTHCFTLTFKNEEDRDTYLPHPAHQAFVETHGKIVEDVFVIDYVAKGE